MYIIQFTSMGREIGRVDGKGGKEKGRESSLNKTKQEIKIRRE